MIEFPVSLSERVIHVNGPVDLDAANLIMAGLLFYDRRQPGAPITLVINSPGGVVYNGLQVYDAMMQVKSPLYTIGMGQVAGLSALFLAAGGRGRRFLSPESHVFLTGLAASHAQEPIVSKEVNRLRELIFACYGRHTSMAEQDHAQWLDKPMPPQEALRLGIADHQLDQLPPMLPPL